MPAALVLLAFALVAGCGPDETLLPFDVTLTTASDCQQVGQGAVQCVDAAELASISVRGRWVLDYRGIDTFVLLTDDGRTLPGVYFVNDGQVPTRSCLGQGGYCHFARVQTQGEDPQSGCLRVEEHVVDVVTLDGQLTGQTSAVAFTEEGCATPFVRELIVTVQGTEVEEKVAAREEFAP